DELLDTAEPLSHPDLQHRFTTVHHNILAVMERSRLEEVYEQRHSRQRKFLKWSSIGAAAAVLLVFFLVRYLMPQQAPDGLINPPRAIVVDAMPGSNKAILEIGGEQHALDDRKAGIVLGTSEVQYEDGADAKISIDDPSAVIGLRTPR